MGPQIRIPISFDLDLVKPNKFVTSDGKIVFCKCNQKEIRIAGWMLIAFIDGEAVECASFKNGPHGCADIVNEEKQETRLVHGNIQAFLCIPHKPGEKIPKIEIFVSDMELTEA